MVATQDCMLPIKTTYYKIDDDPILKGLRVDRFHGQIVRVEEMLLWPFVVIGPETWSPK